MSYVGKITAGGSTHLVGSTLYGTCATQAATANKIVTCSNFDKLYEGVTIHVLFKEPNGATNPTLNVNSTGAIPIYFGQSQRGYWAEKAVVSFTYSTTAGVNDDVAAWIQNDTYYTYTDTKNTAGSSNSADKMYLIGAKSQSSTGVTTYSNSGVYATNGALVASTMNGYTLADACAKSVDTSISNGSTSTNLPTTAAVATFVASQVTGTAAFQGSLGSSTSTADYTQATLEASSYVKGWYWVVNASGTYVGKNCGVGDLVYATKDKSSAYSASDFTVVQNEMDSITNAEIDAIVADE